MQLGLQPGHRRHRDERVGHPEDERGEAHERDEERKARGRPGGTAEERGQRPFRGQDHERRGGDDEPGADRALRGQAPTDDVQHAKAHDHAEPGRRHEHDDVLLAEAEHLADEAGRERARHRHQHVRERDVEE